MIGKNTIKLIKSLSIKKYRQREGLFLAEGDKLVLEALQSGILAKKVIGTADFISTHDNELKKVAETIEATPAEIRSISLLMNPQNCLAICEIPENPVPPTNLDSDLTLYLDGIQDPGNLGTIIRLCDWFGLEHVFCSPDTADAYNPKVVQASMGSLFRTKLWYMPISQLPAINIMDKIPVFGAFLEGNNIYTEILPEKAILVVGNEGNGIRRDIEPFINKKIKIPGFTKKSGTAESLNVAVATGIICAEFKRQNNFRTYSK